MFDLGQPQVQIAVEEWCLFYLFDNTLCKQFFFQLWLIPPEIETKVVDSNSGLQCLLCLDMSHCRICILLCRPWSNLLPTFGSFWILLGQLSFLLCIFHFHFVKVYSIFSSCFIGLWKFSIIALLGFLPACIFFCLFWISLGAKLGVAIYAVATLCCHKIWTILYSS